jgi:hypothetical protein
MIFVMLLIIVYAAAAAAAAAASAGPKLLAIGASSCDPYDYYGGACWVSSTPHTLLPTSMPCTLRVNGQPSTCCSAGISLFCVT